jgi:hypothetical protein
MTHWTNPDVWLRPGTASTNPFVVLPAAKLPTDLPLEQYGMEYNPIAINEVLAYSFARKSGGQATATPRFYAELVNVLTAPELGTVTPAAPGLGTGANNASVLDLAGFQYTTNPSMTTPWDGGCWDILFTADDPLSRPDPICGQLRYGGTFNYFAVTGAFTFLDGTQAYKGIKGEGAKAGTTGVADPDGNSIVVYTPCGGKGGTGGVGILQERCRCSQEHAE